MQQDTCFAAPRGASLGASRAAKTRSLLLAGLLWFAWADAALAGPTTTSGTGPTTTSTTTTTAVPTTTTTAVPTTTTTTTTTSTTNTTTTPTSSTTTTTGPGLSGNYPFEDNRSRYTNASYLSINTTPGQEGICVAGEVVDYDRLALPSNKIVTITYRSQGTISKESDKKVVGEFPTTVLVTLTIDNLNTTVVEPPELPYVGVATAQCVLKASLVKSGERDRVRLRCDLGENLSGFSPSLTSEGSDSQVQNVRNAYRHGKRARIATKKGKLKIVHYGEPAESAPVTCSLQDD